MFSCYLLYDGEEQTIQWPKRTKRQTMIYKTLHSNLKIEQHGSNLLWEFNQSTWYLCRCVFIVMGIRWVLYL